MTSKKNHFFLLIEEDDDEETPAVQETVTKPTSKAATKRAKRAAKAAKKAEELAPLRKQLSEMFSGLRKKEAFWIKVRACNGLTDIDIIAEHLKLKREMDQLIIYIDKVGEVPYESSCDKCRLNGHEEKMIIQRRRNGSVAAVCKHCKHSTAQFPDESLKRELLSDVKRAKRVERIRK
jgi:hypothetical protein